MSAAERRAGYIAGLRQLADLLEQHEDVPLPYTGVNGVGNLDWMLVTDSPDSQRATMRRLAGLIDDVAYRPYGQTARITGRLAGLHVGVLADQEAVCERTETVEYRLVLPTPGAGES